MAQRQLWCRWLDLDPFKHARLVNDALAVYLLDATIGSAFVARWCAAQRVEIVDGVYRVRDDEPTPRIERVRSHRVD
jgi:hypothetical protein